MTNQNKTLAVLLLFLTLGCGGLVERSSQSEDDEQPQEDVWEAVEYFNTGRACLFREEQLDGESIPPSSEPGTDPVDARYPLTANIPLVIHVLIDDCASGCLTVESTSCEVTVQGNELHVESSAHLTNPTGVDICTTACVVVQAACSVPALPEGTYEVKHGEDTQFIDIPGIFSCIF